MSLDTPPRVDESAERDQFPGVLPGKPVPFTLQQGEGEKSVLFGDLFTILLSGDETEGQYDVFTAEGHAGSMIPAHLHMWTHEIFYVVDGAVHVWMDDEHGTKVDRILQTGDFAYVPKNIVHAYRFEATSKVLGTSTAGFGRFFHAMGRKTDKPGIPGRDEVFVPSREQMQAAGEKYGTLFRPEFRFDETP
jgi:quercetin 2,3-dioxygenase